MAAKSRAEPTQIVVVVDDVLTLSCYASYLKAVRASVTALRRVVLADAH